MTKMKCKDCKGIGTEFDTGEYNDYCVTCHGIGFIFKYRTNTKQCQCPGIEMRECTEDDAYYCEDCGGDTCGICHGCLSVLHDMATCPACHRENGEHACGLEDELENRGWDNGSPMDWNNHD